MLPKNLFKFELFFLKKQKLYLAIFAIISIIISALDVLDTYIIKGFINQLISDSVSDDFVIKYMIIFYVWWEFWNITYRIGDYCLLKIMPTLIADVTFELTKYALDHSHKYFQENFAGSITNKIKELGKSSAKIFEIITTKIIIRGLSVILALILVSTASPIFTLLILSWLVLFIGINAIFFKKMHDLSEQFAINRNTTQGKLVDLIGNISSVRLFANKPFESGYFNKYIEKTKSSHQRLELYNNKINYIKGFVNNLLAVSIIYFIVILYREHKITVGDFYLILGLMMHIMHTMWDFLKDFADMIEEIGTCKQSLSLISPRHEIEDDEKATELQVSNANIEFQNVTFYYLKKQPLFEQLNLSIESGSKVGLVGFSGSGKSTFVNLIIRLFDVNKGHIKIDGQDIAKVTQESLRRNIAFIPQEPMLFHRTLADNIRYGKLNATDEEIIEAAKLANAHDFILKTEFGYESLVGERGIKLSGGQRQRIAIARAILKNAPILILDEATSSLDSITEKKIQESLDFLMKGRTTLVVAHRLSTLLNMDRIIVFDKGKVVDDGTHVELLERTGIYANLWNSQVDGFIGFEETD